MKCLATSDGHRLQKPHQYSTYLRMNKGILVPHFGNPLFKSEPTEHTHVCIQCALSHP